LPVEAGQGRARHIDIERTFRLLDHEFDIHTDCEAFVRRLDYLVNHAKQPGTPSVRHRYDIRREGTAYTITEDGRPHATEPDAAAALVTLYWEVHQAADRQFAGEVGVHAGTGIAEGRRFLVVGPKFAGKSTLMMRLLYCGVEGQGDEMAMLKDGEVIAFPRRFHVRERSLAYLPELRPLLADLPTAADSSGERIYGIEPDIAGTAWRIDRGAPDAIFYLESGHGGRTRVRDCAKTEMCRLIMPQCAPKRAGNRALVGEVVRLVSAAATYTLENGHPAASAAAILECLSKQRRRRRGGLAIGASLA
jgi:hypothetical protein